MKPVRCPAGDSLSDPFLGNLGGSTFLRQREGYDCEGSIGKPVATVLLGRPPDSTKIKYSS